MFFSGKPASGKRVDLRGKSKSTETREQTLERARLERLQRQENKRRNQKALVLQSFWRGRSASSHYLKELRADWLQEFGSDVPQASWFCNPSSRYVRGFLVFARSGTRFSWREDGAALVAVCRAATRTTTAQGELAFVAAARDASLKGLVLFRAQRLAQLCLHSLYVNRSSLQDLSSGAAGSDAAAVLVEFLVKFAAPDTWQPVLGAAESSQVVWRLLSHLAQHGMFVQLGSILSASSSPPAPTAPGRKAAPEALVAQLVVRYLSVCPPTPSTHPSPAPIPAPGLAPGPAPGAAPRPPALPPSSLHPLLCVPNLWHKCPPLAPISGRITAACVHACALLEPWQLVDQLPEGIVQGGKAAAAAALLGNIVSAAPKALAAVKTQDNTKALHRRLTTLIQTLLSLIPMHTFLPSSPLSPAAADLSSPRQDAPAPTGSSHHTAVGPPGPLPGIPQLLWDEEEMVPVELSQQVELMYGGEGIQLLGQLITALLPHTLVQPAGAVGGQEVTDGVQPLCHLVLLLLLHSAHQQNLLLRLAVSCGLVQRLWFSYVQPMVALHGLGPAGGRLSPSGLADEAWWVLPLSVLCPVFHAWLQTADLDEFYKQQQPLPHAQLYSRGSPRVGLIGVLKGALWQLLWQEFDKSLNPPNSTRVACCRSLGQLLQLLFDLNSRRPFVPFTAFHAEQLAAERFTPEALSSARNSAAGAAGADASGGGPLKTQLGATSSRSWALLHYAPCLVPFLERARLFQEIVSEDREWHYEMERQSQYEALQRGIDMEGDGGQRFITIRRSQLLTDGFEHLNKLGDKLKGRIRIQFINEHGVAEAGVDGGGLFKDFMEDLIQQGFNPEYGVFKTTPHNQLYPNPAAYRVLPDAPRMLEFMGRMLGKAVYEGILSELPFAGFFLKRFRGSHCSLSDLPWLDPEVYRSLLSLRDYRGNIADLCLTFSITIDNFGQQAEVELKPGGKDIAVTADNVIEYIHRMADFRLNKELHASSHAFLRGFFDIIHPAWVRMFNEEEIQMLISGSDATAEQLLELAGAGAGGEGEAVAAQLPLRGLDLEDMKLHTHYAGGYHEEHPVILSFWQALSSMDPRQQRALLKFVTSSSRAPLLGFKYLEPPLCIQMAGHVLDPAATERLPTSATCMNLLKLPPYGSVAEMLKKLLLSSQMGQGFHLS